MKTICLCAVAAFLSCGQALGQDIDVMRIAQRDNGNNVIDTDNEIRIWVLHKNNPRYQRYDSDYDGYIVGPESDREQAAAEDAIVYDIEDYKARLAAGSPEVARIASPPPKPARAPTPTRAFAFDINLLVRRNPEDISLFSEPKDRKKAVGAEFAVSVDEQLDNTAWSALGVVAAPMTFYRDTSSGDFRFRPHLAEGVFVPAVQFERLSNSRLSGDDIDKTAISASAHLGFANLLGTQFLSGRVAAITDFEGEAKLWNATAAWQPVNNSVCLGGPCPLGRIPIFFRFSPSLHAEYSRAIASDGLGAFTEKDEALRVGATASLSIWPFRPAVADFLDRLAALITYKWWWDVDSDRTFSLLDAAITYALDEEERVGLTASYRVGNIEDTGQEVEFWRLGLSVKY